MAARMTISIPEALRDRMNQEPGVVWSRVAAEAFESKLAEIKRQQELSSMEDVIARLRAESEGEGNPSFEAGHDEGTEWAKRFANPSQLRKVARAREDDELFRGGGNEGPSWFEVFAVEVLGVDKNEVRDFPLDEIFGDAIEAVSIDDQPDYLRGWCAGAGAVWDVVKDSV